MKRIGDNVLDYVLSDLSWKVDFPAFMKEVCEGSQTTPYAITFQILNNILGILAERAIEINDPALHIIMFRLSLYEGSHTKEGIDTVKMLQETIKRNL